MKKKSNVLSVVIAVICLVVVIGVVYCVAGGSYSSKHMCDWCGDTPTKEYKISDNEISYVCKDCSSRCMYCGAKATGHAPNYFNMMVFYCDDCYDTM